MSLDLCGSKLLIFILFAEFECDDSYFSIQEGKCIDVSVPGDVIMDRFNIGHVYLVQFFERKGKMKFHIRVCTIKTSYKVLFLVMF